MVSTVTWKCNQVTNARKMKGAARVGNSATGRNGKTNKGMGRQGRQTKTKGIWCGKAEDRGKGLEQNNKQSKKSHDVSRGVTKICDITRDWTILRRLTAECFWRVPITS